MRCIKAEECKEWNIRLIPPPTLAVNLSLPNENSKDTVPKKDDSLITLMFGSPYHNFGFHGLPTFHVSSRAIFVFVFTLVNDPPASTLIPKLNSELEFYRNEVQKQYGGTRVAHVILVGFSETPPSRSTARYHELMRTACIESEIDYLAVDFVQSQLKEFRSFILQAAVAMREIVTEHQRRLEEDEQGKEKEATGVKKPTDANQCNLC